MPKEYYSLKYETHKVEKIRVSVKANLHNDEPQPEWTPKKSLGMEF